MAQRAFLLWSLLASQRHNAEPLPCFPLLRPPRPHCPRHAPHSPLPGAFTTPPCPPAPPPGTSSTKLTPSPPSLLHSLARSRFLSLSSYFSSKCSSQSTLHLSVIRLPSAPESRPFVYGCAHRVYICPSKETTIHNPISGLNCTRPQIPCLGVRTPSTSDCGPYLKMVPLEG